MCKLLFQLRADTFLYPIVLLQNTSVVVKPCAVSVLGPTTVPYYKANVPREMLSCKTGIISLVNCSV